MTSVIAFSSMFDLGVGYGIKNRIRGSSRCRQTPDRRDGSSVRLAFLRGRNQRHPRRRGARDRQSATLRGQPPARGDSLDRIRAQLLSFLFEHDLAGVRPLHDSQRCGSAWADTLAALPKGVRHGSLGLADVFGTCLHWIVAFARMAHDAPGPPHLAVPARCRHARVVAGGQVGGSHRRTLFFTPTDVDAVVLLGQLPGITATSVLQK